VAALARSAAARSVALIDRVKRVGIALAKRVQKTRTGFRPVDEILHLALTLGEGYAFSKVLDATLARAWRRCRRRHGQAAFSGEKPPPTVIHVEGTESIIFRLDLPDGEPLIWNGPVYPRGRRRSPPRWVAGAGAAQALAEVGEKLLVALSRRASGKALRNTSKPRIPTSP
jgi:hypothetical protein